MNEIEIKDFYENKVIAFEKLASYVREKIYKKLVVMNKTDYLKIPISTRVKKLDSLIEKTLYRKKYANPLIDISDIVGIRIVVLTYDELKSICDILNEIFDGNIKIDRNYNDERSINPYLFDYQSIHFVLKFENLVIDNIDISDISCEIQVRTILQHAYAELTHDLIYKSDLKINQETKRKASRSMALIESTDCLFIETKHEVENLHKEKNQLVSLTEEYSVKYGFNIQNNDKLNTLIYENIHELISKVNQEKIEEYFILKEHILKEQAKLLLIVNKLLFKQSLILLIFYFIDLGKVSWLKENWLLDDSILNTILINLGHSI